MNQIERALALVALLASVGHRCALVGGLAVSTRTRERFTRDMDFAVAVSSDRESERLALGLQRLGFRLLQVIEQEARGVIATLRFRHPEDPEDEPSVDPLCGSSGIEREIVRDAETIEIAAGIGVPVASVPHLIAMRVLSVSPVGDQDLADLRVLIEAASPGDLERARAAVRSIEERGFQRGKDLRGELEAHVARVRGQEPA